MNDYQILGISENVTYEELKKAYRTMAIKYHPDNNPENEEKAREMFQKVQDAFGRIVEKRKNTQTNEDKEENSKSNPFYEWYASMKSYEKRMKDLENRESDIHKKKKEKENEFQSVKSDYNFSKIDQNKYRFNIKESLQFLLKEIERYYNCKINEINNSLFRIFKEKQRLEIAEQQTKIFSVLEETKKNMEEAYKEDDDSEIFTFHFKEEDIKIMQSISSKSFNAFIISIQNYQKKQPEIVSKLNENHIKMEQLESEIQMFDVLLSQIQEELRKIKIRYYKMFGMDISATNAFNFSEDVFSSRKM